MVVNFLIACIPFTKRPPLHLSFSFNITLHCALYYRKRRLRIHDVQQTVNYFIASGPENRSAHNVFCFRINRDFDETPRPMTITS